MSLVIEGLNFSYGQNRVLNQLSFKLEPAEIIGVVGPNGAGKSTLIKLLTRILKPGSGKILIDKQDIKTYSRLKLAQKLAVVPQSTDLPEAFSAQEIVMMGRTPHLGFLHGETQKDLDIVECTMRRTDVWKFANRMIDSLSGGEKQRVLLARALAQEPSYLLLDEPTNHLDLRYQIEVLRYLQAEVKKGLGALIVLHDLNLAARSCDRILVLHQGKLVAEGPAQDVLTEKLIQEVYQARVSVFKQPHTEHTVVLPKW